METEGVLLCALCLLSGAAPSMSWTPPVDNKRLDVLQFHPSDTPAFTAHNWEFCRQKCQDDKICVMFAWVSYWMSCRLYPPAQMFSGVNMFQGNHLGMLIGRIDRTNGNIIWLSIGEPAIPPSARLPLITDATECRDACESSAEMLPCSAVQMVANQCSMFAGYFKDYANVGKGDAGYKAASYRLNSTDPTGSGTLILADKLPPKPPVVAVAPFTITAITVDTLDTVALKPLIIYGGETYDGCVQRCHDTPSCRSFNYLERQKCNLYDVALKGTIVLGPYRYGIIDRDASVSTVTYLVPSAETVSLAQLSAHIFVTTQEECAMLCYEFHQPFYCTSFHITVVYDSSGYGHTCFLYAGELKYWTPSSVSAPVSVALRKYYYGIIEGRKPYNQHYDAGDPMNPFRTTSMTTATTTISTTTTNSFCTVRSNTETTIFKIAQTGVRIISPPGTVTNNVRSDSSCAIRCHLNPVCRSFSYSLSRQECHQHCLPSTDPNVITADDPEFIISSWYGKEAYAAYKSPTAADAKTASTDTTTMENLEDCPKTVPKGCVSPFTYVGITYARGCTIADNNRTCWCATATIYDGGRQSC